MFELNNKLIVTYGLITFGALAILVFLHWIVKNLRIKHVWTIHIVLGLILGLLITLFLNLTIDSGSWRDFLIGDNNDFIWPATIQNFMWFVFSIALMMLYAESLFTKYDNVNDACNLETLIEGRTEPVRFLIWMIPTLGFIGTVIGMSFALSRLANTEDLNFSLENGLLQIVMKDLGTAFYTTILGLIMNIICYGLLSFLTYKHKKTLANRSIHEN